jgi:hypothetical protein
MLIFVPFGIDVYSQQVANNSNWAGGQGRPEFLAQF